jgi:cell division protein FtsW (lipid II flippase)
MAEQAHRNLLQTIEELRWDVWLAATTIGLVIFGVVMVYSASASAPKPYKFLLSQIAWGVMGLAAMVILQRIDYHRYAQPRFVFGFLGACALLLIVVFFFGAVNGAHRWIVIRSLSI